MRLDPIELDATLPRSWIHRLTLHDAKALRLLLAGGSVVDWRRASFATLDDVDRLLSLYDITLSNRDDRQRLRFLFNEAVNYVEHQLKLTVPDAVRNPEDVRDVFLLASQAASTRPARLACTILKLMHVLQHLEAAELRTRVALPEAELLELARKRIVHIAEQMRAEGWPVVAFYGSRKTRQAVITKLLAKRDDVAARIFDKLRFRMVVHRKADIIPTLTWLLRHLIPFNHVVPGQSHNNLLDPDTVDASLPDTLRDGPGAEDDVDAPLRAERSQNVFSGATYRTINLIFDLPVPIPHDAIAPGDALRLGKVALVQCELQVVDEATAVTNEEGDNAHALYKARQHEVVRQRLMGDAEPDDAP